MLQQIQSLRQIVLEAKHAVFFGGAGVSTDSGIPDFRGNGGLYASETEDSKEYYLSRECLAMEPEKFFDFFRKHMLFEGVEPNGAHFALAELENRGILKAVITQNIDGLHQKAGSKRVIELHGISDRHYCVACKKVYDGRFVAQQTGVPRCQVCGGVVRPDVTLYGEGLDGFCFADARQQIEKADVLLVGGTSLVVQPAASLLDAFRGKHLIIVNYSPTPYDSRAEFVLRESLSRVLQQITARNPLDK